MKARPLLAVLLALALAGAAPAREVDPFYLDLLREGQVALDRGDARQAVRDLRLACFGLLDDTARLGGCLGWLLLAQVATGEREEVATTASRLVDIEARFQGLSRADLPAAARTAIEDELYEVVPAETLAAVPVLRAAGDRRALARLSRLGERERLAELERLAAADPADLRWRLLLAEAELARERPAAAVERLSGLDAAGADGRVGCLRGEALTALGRCGEALPLLEACPAAVATGKTALGRATCLLAGGDLARAATALAALPAGTAGSAEAGRLRRDLERAQRRAAETAAVRRPATSPAPPPAAEPVSQEPPASTATPPPPRPTPRGRRTGADAGGQRPAAPAVPPPAKPTALPLPSVPAAAVATPTPAPATPPVATPAPPAVAPPEADPAPSPATALPPAAAATGAPARGSAGEPTAEERARLDELRREMGEAKRAGELDAVLREASGLADRYPDFAPAQLLAGQIAYRGSRWPLVVQYLGRSGLDPERQPELLFYLAVARFETGDRSGAKSALDAVLPRLVASDFVRRYTEKIRGAVPAAP